MSDPVVTAAAVALATKAVEGVAEGGRAAFAALAKLIRRKFGHRYRLCELLLYVEAEPADRQRQLALAEALRHAVIEDAEFAAELHGLWRDAHDGSADRTGGSLLNTVTGEVHGGIVQAHDVHGGISFGRT